MCIFDIKSTEVPESIQHEEWSFSFSVGSNIPDVGNMKIPYIKILEKS